jgi:hypothetical protein
VSRPRLLPRVPGDVRASSSTRARSATSVERPSRSVDGHTTSSVSGSLQSLVPFRVSVR